MVRIRICVRENKKRSRKRWDQLGIFFIILYCYFIPKVTSSPFDYLVFSHFIRKSVFLLFIYKPTPFKPS